MQLAGEDDVSYVSDIYGCHQLLSYLSGRQDPSSMARDWRVMRDYKKLHPQVTKIREGIDKEKTALYPRNHPLAAIFSFETSVVYREKSKKLLTSYLDFIDMSKAMHKVIQDNIADPAKLEKVFHGRFVKEDPKNRKLLVKVWEFGDFGLVQPKLSYDGQLTVVSKKTADDVMTHSCFVSNQARYAGIGFQQDAYNSLNKHLAFLILEAKPMLKALVTDDNKTRAARYLAPYLRLYTAVLANHVRTFNHLRSSLSIEHTLHNQ